ncbi:MAG: HEAT repeat domain-containing protein, partial [Planctomycetota bacterium]
DAFRVVTKTHYDVGKAGGETRVYPLVSMKSNYLSHAGTHTSACGTTAYIGDLSAQGRGYRQSVFVCEPIGHLVTRSIIQSDGVRFVAKRAEPNRDFLASTDTWFRPSSLATGPDGGLYLADMYRLWVEHPKFLPKEIAEKLDWRAGEDRGRVYRIVPTGAKSQPYQAPESIDDAVRLLTEQNGWRQFTGQRLIVEAGFTNAAPRLRELLHHKNPTTRLHAVWSLAGLEQLERNDVLTLAADSNPQVRIAAIRLAERFLEESQVFESVIRAAADSDSRVCLAACIALSKSTKKEEVTRVLCQSVLRHVGDEMFVDGWLSSVGERSGAILSKLASASAFCSDREHGDAALVRNLGMVVGCRAKMDEVATVIDLLSATGANPAWWEIPMIDGLAIGLRRHSGSRLSIQHLIAKPPIELQHSVTRLQESLAHYQKIASDRKQSVETRRETIALLAHQPFEDSVAAFRELLKFDQPTEIQQSCFDAMVASRSSNVAEVLLEAWPDLAPSVRGVATAELLRRTDSTRKALAAMKSGRIDAKTLGIDQRVRLLKHANADIRAQATLLFGGAVSSDRRQIASKYEAALAMECSATRGADVFRRVCANCHRVNGEGQETGPDLSDSANRSKLALLHDILDPNSKVEPRYLAQNILTSDGTIYRGLVSSETADAVVISMAGGKQATVNRDDIDSMKVDTVSLMPEGIEKDVTRQQMADLLEYLTRPARRSSTDNAGI